MRIQFCHNCTEEFVAEFEVERVPTEDESELIYEAICDSMDAWEKEHGDYGDFDFYQCCRDAASRYIKLINNPVVKTFYI